MSYIRALSNPEGLYIWGDEQGAAICLEGNIQYMPIPVFETLLKRWWANHDGFTDREEIKYQGAALTYETGVWKWVLSYKDWEREIDLYETTLVYLCVENCHRWGWKTPGRNKVWGEDNE